MSAAQAEADRRVQEATEAATEIMARARADADRAIRSGQEQHDTAVARGQSQHDALVARGTDEGARLVAAGLAEQARLVSQTEVVQAAYAESARILDTAHADTDRMRNECDSYVDDQAGQPRGHPHPDLAHRRPRPHRAAVGCGGGLPGLSPCARRGGGCRSPAVGATVPGGGISAAGRWVFSDASPAVDASRQRVLNCGRFQPGRSGRRSAGMLPRKHRPPDVLPWRLDPANHHGRSRKCHLTP